MDKKVKESLNSASYLTYHWRQYSFEQLEKEMVRVCGLCNKALGIPKDDSITDFERGFKAYEKRKARKAEKWALSVWY